MREFTKQVITALKEDDWEVRGHGIRHTKSMLIIDTDDMQPREVPFKFSWFERRVVKYYARQVQERMLVAKFLECRLTPKRANNYGDTSFL